MAEVGRDLVDPFELRMFYYSVTKTSGSPGPHSDVLSQSMQETPQSLDKQFQGSVKTSLFSGLWSALMYHI